MSAVWIALFAVALGLATTFVSLFVANSKKKGS
jgi:hypothetical protein